MLPILLLLLVTAPVAGVATDPAAITAESHCTNGDSFLHITIQNASGAYTLTHDGEHIQATVPDADAEARFYLPASGDFSRLTGEYRVLHVTNGTVHHEATVLVLECGAAVTAPEVTADG